MVSQSTPDRSGRAGRAYRRVWWCLAITVAGAGSVISLLSVPGWILVFVVAISIAVTAFVAKAVEDALEVKLPFSRVTLMTVIVTPAAIAIPGWIALIGVWAMPCPYWWGSPILRSPSTSFRSDVALVVKRQRGFSNLTSRPRYPPPFPLGSFNAGP